MLGRFSAHYEGRRYDYVSGKHPWDPVHPEDSPAVGKLVIYERSWGIPEVGIVSEIDGEWVTYTTPSGANVIRSMTEVGRSLHFRNAPPLEVRGPCAEDCCGPAWIPRVS